MNQFKEKNNKFEATLYHVNLPMNFTFGHLAAQRNKSDSLVLKIRFNNYIGIGECAPRQYVTGETTTSIIESFKNTDLKRIRQKLEYFIPKEILNSLQQTGFAQTFGISGTNNLICLLELAVFDLLGHMLQKSGLSIISLPVVPKQNKMLKISQVLDQNLSVENFLETRGPFHFIKIKGNLDLKKDIEIVKTIRNSINDDIPIMIDANMNWSLEDAIKHLNMLQDVGVNYVEEPLSKKSWNELKILKQKTHLPIMLDESISNLNDLEIAISEKCCDAVNVRISKCGGLFNSINIIRNAKENGLAFQIGVQVAECGPLINASQILAFSTQDAITVESGQSDLFFTDMIIHPKPIIDRKLNVIYETQNFGLGFTDTTNIINEFKIL